jgi:hypothetical protein
MTKLLKNLGSHSKDSGIVKGTDVYDSSGYVKIGYISGNTLVTSAGGNRITLRK